MMHCNTTLLQTHTISNKTKCFRTLCVLLLLLLPLLFILLCFLFTLLILEIRLYFSLWSDYIQVPLLLLLCLLLYFHQSTINHYHFIRGVLLVTLLVLLWLLLYFHQSTINHYLLLVVDRVEVTFCFGPNTMNCCW